MAGERRLNWGADATDAQYRTGDDAANNRFVLAEDLDGGTILLEYDETASEWVSRGPVNLSGNDVSNVGTLSATAVNTESLVIGGKLYEEDDNSPINSNQDSFTYDLSTDSREVIIIPDHSQAGQSDFQINGDAGSNYNYVDTSDTETTGATAFETSGMAVYSYLRFWLDRNAAVRFYGEVASAGRGRVYRGENTNLSNKISSISFSGTNSDTKARVYRREMNI